MKFIHTICFSLALSLGSLNLPVQAQSSNGYFLHTVTKGQSLYSIASMYNVSTQDIIQLNPGSETRIRAGEVLKIPQTQSSNKSNKTFHTIQAGETLYQLTVKYNVTAQAICAANPGLSASNFRIGQVISIPMQEESQPAVVATHTPAPEVRKNDWRDMHKVQRKETIYSISRMYGITEEELIEANPELRNGKLKKGRFLFIPYPKQAATGNTVSQPSNVPTNEELFNESKADRKSIKTIKAAVMLPLKLNSSISQAEQSRITEFYEGFLIAVDSLKKQGVSMDIYTFDTNGTTSTINSILSQKTMEDMDIIFGVASGETIKPLAQFAEKHQIRLVIPFTPKVEQVFNNPMIYQVNTPQSYLYSEVYEHFIRKFKNNNVIFLDDGSGDREKAEFIKGLKAELKDNKVKFTQLQLGNEIDPNKVIAAMDTTAQTIFIPTSGKNTALTRLLPHLSMVRREHPHFDMHLFGYPEWQTYTQDHLASFYELDTYFYSSFYTNNLFPAAINFTHTYRHWYSKDMSNTFPKYGMLGFDIGYFFMKGLAQEGNELESNLNRIEVVPIQTGFKFERVNNWGGFINRKVFFVHFTKDYELIKLDFE